MRAVREHQEKLDSQLFLPAAGPFQPSWVEIFTRKNAWEEEEGVNVGGKKQTSWHDSIPHPKGKEEKPEVLAGETDE